MKVSVEVLDYIFSYLLSDRETLIACSQDPVLSPIAQRHLYHHVTVLINGIPKTSQSNEVLRPDCLSELISKNPHIVYHVRVLEIHLVHAQFCGNAELLPLFDALANAMFTFPVLECIMLVSEYDPWHRDAWFWSTHFRAALEDRLNLPTLKEVHFVGRYDFPLSLLNSCKDIEGLVLAGGFNEAEGGFSDSTLPRLKFLELSATRNETLSSPLLCWLKLHIIDLQSLKFRPLSMTILSELLEVCSGTLETLEVDLLKSDYFSRYTFKTKRTNTLSLPKLSWSALPNLQQLKICAGVYMESGSGFDQTPGYYCTSWLPALADTVNSFVSSPQHLILDINLKISTFLELTEIDISPLAVLGTASESIPYIDLYIHTGIFPSALTHAQVMSLFADYEDIMRSIKEGVLVVHAEKTASDYV